MSDTLSGTLPPSMSGSARPARVVSVPAAHPYVERISAAEGVEVLPDPPVPGAAPGVWWPPVVLDPEWIGAHRDAADLLHIHFGTESFPPGHLSACIAAAHAVGWPVVFTVHDLAHPQLAEMSAYDGQLDELVPHADAVLTLTAGAADEIARRWGRDAFVVPHPAVIGSDTAVPPVGVDAERRVGVHLKDLRPNVDGPGTVRALRDAVRRLREAGTPARAEVRMHTAVRDESARDDVRRLCEGSPDLVLIEHERLSDAELAVSLSGLDACVLPYRHGTHSGWLELCWDLGVPVAAPAVGFYGEQHDDGSVAVFDSDGERLAAALETLWAHEPCRPGSLARAESIVQRRTSRARTDTAVADFHRALYRQLLSERVG